MKKKMKKVLGFILAFAMIITGIPAYGDMQQVKAETTTGETTYEIYPIPQEITYGEGTVDLADSLNVVLEEGLDDATVKRMSDILATQDIDLADVQTDEVSEDKTNILVGIEGSNGVADTFFQDIEYEETLFEEMDSYILYIQDNTIAVLGRDTDAAFWGLTTLKLIVNQLEGTEIRHLRIDDYSEAKFRGFIEGYYGIPWSDEDRISLMEFGGDFKMNTYIFAPKDDEYHSAKWATLYPEDRLEEMRQMVEAGNNSKCKFVWSIHPFMHNKVTAEDYDEKLQIIKQKFEQLYSIGVRQFGILADDANSATAVQRQLCIDMDAWCKEKGDVYDLVFVPQQYNKGWTTVTDGRAPYYDELMDGMPESVQVMWTGDGVCGWVTQGTFDWFEEKVGREAFMWLNWPVNDINSKRLLMGKGEVLGAGVDGFTGILTNPMQQAEASKVALFAVADYTWNRDGFNVDKSWVDSFKYIDSGAPDALYELAKHLCDPTPNSHGLTLQESEELAPYLVEFQAALKAGDSIVELGETLVEAFDNIALAADLYRENGENTNLIKEMDPWISSLKDLAIACSQYIQTAIAIELGEDDSIWGHYSEASAALESSKTYQVKNLNNYANVEAGYKRLIPFAKELSEAVESSVKQVIIPSGDTEIKGDIVEPIVIRSGLNGIHEGKVENLIDGNDSTYVWFNGAANKDSFIGVDLGKVETISNIRIRQGRNDNDADIMKYAILEYSEDGTNYTQVQTYTDTRVIDKDLSETPVKARYVRIRAQQNSTNWFCIREFGVTKEGNADIYRYSNLENPQFEVGIAVDTATITAPSAITLAKNQYIGMKLPRIRDLSAITGTFTNSDKLTVEYSLNAIEWKTATLPENQPDDARYIRIINKTNDAVSLGITEFKVTSNEIFPVSMKSHTFNSVENPNNLFDGEYTTQGVFMNSQTAGYKVIYDLGQTINIHTLKMVTNDNENDYLRNGKISLSMDGEQWSDVMLIGNQTNDATLSDPSIEDIFVYEGGYRVKNTELEIPMDARYLKLEITKTKSGDNKYTRVQEIILNNGEYIPQENNPTFLSNAVEEGGMAPTNMVDGNIATAYAPNVEDGEAGFITYRLSQGTDISQLNILQSPKALSSATVSVRHGENQWTEIGVLDKSLNVFSNLGEEFENIYEIKMEWDDVAPVIYEICAMTISEDIPVKSIRFTDASGAAVSSLSMNLESSTKLTATIAPENAGNKVLKWSSSNPEVVSVAKDGTLTAVGLGVAMITVESARYSMSVQIPVSVNHVDSLKIPTKDMTAEVCSFHSGEGGDKAIDGDPNTLWHSDWDVEADPAPHWIKITFPEPQMINKFTYLPRQTGGKNGIATAYDLMVTKPDGTEVKVTSGTWAEDTTEKVVTFDSMMAASVKLVITTGVGGFGSAGEISIYKENLMEKEDLVAFLEEVSGKQKEEGYKEEDWTAFETALANAGAAAENDAVTEEQLLEVYAQLTEAVKNLVPHIPSSAWFQDETNHWHACTAAGCTEKYDLAAHTWNEGEVTKEPTATVAGEKTFICTVCEATKIESVPATGSGEGGEQHTPSTEWSKDAANHWHACTFQGCEVNQKHDVAAHTWDAGTVTKQPTTTETGEKTFTCTVCEATKIESVPATGEGEEQHTPSTEWSKDAANHWHSCTFQGCEVNQKHDVAAHIWDAGTVTKQPTATAAGEKTFTCSICKTTKKESVPATGTPGGNNAAVQEQQKVEQQKTEIESLKTQGATFKSEEYTAETWNAYQNALNKVNTLISSGKVTSAELEKAKAELKTAMGALVKAPATQTPEEKPQDTVTHKKNQKLTFKDASYKVTKEGNTGGEVALTKYTGKGKKFTTPKTITVDGVKYKVTAIGNNAFKNNKTLTKITISANIRTIGNNVFQKCEKLTSITIGKDVTKLGKNVFKNSKKLKNIIFKTTKLKADGLAKKSLAGISKTTKVKVPKKQLKIYQNLFKTKGLAKGIKISK